jgi:hypothetical protein
MKAVEEIAPLQGVTSSAIEIEPPAPRDEDLMVAAVEVEDALEPTAPLLLLVQLVEDPEPARLREFALAECSPVFSNVGVEVAAPSFIKQCASERRLPALPRPGQKHHLPRVEILFERAL